MSQRDEETTKRWSASAQYWEKHREVIREMLRVLKPGKKLAFAVWHFAESNPFYYTLSRVIDRYGESPPLPPDAPDAFRFAPPGKLLEALASAGAIALSERLLQFSIEAP